jgi:hypothetical protein
MKRTIFLVALGLAVAIGSSYAQKPKKSAQKPKPTYSPGSTVTKVDNPKHHEPTDTVGVVNGTVINYADFNAMMSGYLRKFVKESGNNLVTDSLYSLIVDSAWDNAVTDIVIEQTIQKEHLGLSDSEAVEMIVANPPDFLASQVTDAQGTVHREALRQALTDPRNDSVSQVIIQGERMRLENEKLVAWVAPKATTDAARRSAFDAWLRKAKSKAVVMDKRLAFGFY